MATDNQAGRGPAKSEDPRAPEAAAAPGVSGAPGAGDGGTPADVAMVALDARWRVRSVRAGARFAGMAEGLAEGRGLFEARPELVGTALEGRLMEAMARRAVARAEGYYGPLGAWVAVTAGPTEDGGLVVFCEDVTERRRGEEKCLRLQGIVEASGDGIIGVDAAGRVTDWNAGAERVCGYPAAEVVGRPFVELVAPESRAAAEGAMARVLAGGGVERVELVQVARGGRAVEAAATVAPVRDAAGRVTGASVVSRDVSEERRAARLRAEMQRLESAGAAKDQFLAVLSHELRTPLTPVLMAAGALEQDPAIPPAAREEIAAIRRNVELEARLIDDLLDLNRITRGKLQLDLQAADVHSLIGHALYVARDDIQGKRLWLRMELGAARHAVRADPVRLQQVFWNLLKNAVKFTPAGGTLVVRSSDGEGAVRVEVQDTGIGIEPAALSRIFEAFEQVGAPEAHGTTGSLGLGLAICRALVELHGGKIWAESAGTGRGSTFVVELPATEAAKPAAAAAGPAAPGENAADPPNAGSASAAELAARLAILVVEDHQGTAQMLGRILKGFGHDVATAASVQEASDVASSRHFDLLISDLGLPDGSGLDLMRHVRRQDPDVRGIALSGYGMEEDLRNSAAAGFEAHLIKPVAVQQLKSVIEKVTAGVIREPRVKLHGTPKPRSA